MKILLQLKMMGMAAAVVLISFIAAGCDSKQSSMGESLGLFLIGSGGNSSVIGVNLNKPSTSMLVGGTELLTVTIAPADATNQSVVWSSDDESKATVSSGGLVDAAWWGSAIITVTTEDGSFSSNCVVTVVDLQ